MTPARQPHPDDLFLITREELDRCCSQMSAAGYKVSANYIEALVLSRPHTSPQAPAFTPHIPGKENSNTYRCCEVCPNVLSKPVFRCNCLQPEHDAQVTKAAREQVLDELYKWICEDRESLHRMQIIPALILHSLVIEKIQSLRQQEQP